MTSISRRAFLAAPAALGLSTRADAAQRSFVFITIDDLLSVVHHRERYGVRIRTPNLNRLMQRSLSFANAFCSTPLCNPSRTAIVSGRNPWKTGVHDNATPWWEKVDPWDTFPGLLRQAGWRCFMHGKITHDHGGVDLWKTSGICTEARLHRRDDRLIVDASIARLNDEAAKRFAAPFLLMIGLCDPHFPWDSPEEFSRPYPIDRIVPLDWEGDPPPNPEIARVERA